MPQGWDPSAGEFPTPPRNVQVFSAFQVGLVDIRWDPPSLLSTNTKFTVVGVNIYRSYNDLGVLTRITPFPVGGNVWRDFTDNVLISNEIVNWNTGWQSRGDSVASSEPGTIDARQPTDVLNGFQGGRWTLKTEFPIHKQIGQKILGDAPGDVAVFVNGVRASVYSILGSTGEITLSNQPEFDSTTEKNIGPILPTGPDDEVLVCYYTTKNFVKTDLDSTPVYRVTTVALDTSTLSGLIETPLNYAEPVSLRDTEGLDYIWREAIARNSWIRQQGGERVLLFTRKVCGHPCSICYQDEGRREYYGQPRALCKLCFGTGFIGGFDGPFEIIVVPDDAERKVSQRARGRTLEHSQEMWCGPTPQITHRDFIVKQSNERYAIGATRRVSARGKSLQQHFNTSYLDESNIIYQVPMDGTIGLPFPETKGAIPELQGGAWPTAPNPPGPYPTGGNQVHPLSTEKQNIPDGREERGRSRVFENITY